MKKGRVVGTSLIFVVVILLAAFVIFNSLAYADHGIMTIVREYKDHILNVKRDGKIIASFEGDFKTIQELEQEWTEISFPSFYGEHLVIIIANNLEYEVVTK